MRLPFGEAEIQHALALVVRTLGRLGIPDVDADDLAQQMVAAVCVKAGLGLEVRNLVGMIMSRVGLVGREWHRRRRARHVFPVADCELQGQEKMGGGVRAWHGALLDLTEKQVGLFVAERWKLLCANDIELVLMRYVRGKIVKQCADELGWSLDQTKKKFAAIERILHFGGGRGQQ